MYIIINMNSSYQIIGKKSIFQLGDINTYHGHCVVGQLILDQTGYMGFVLDVVKKDGKRITVYDIDCDREFTFELTDKENRKISRYKICDLFDDLDNAIKTAKKMLNKR